MSVHILAFDTATEVCALGLGSIEEGAPGVAQIASADFVAPRAAMSRLLPAVIDLLDAHGLGIRDVGRIVVGRGPGSFTGVRIGVATAKGLAHGLGVPLHGVGTLDAVAWALARTERGLVGVIGDAMRGEVYPALFACEEGRARRLSDDRVMHPLDAARAWRDRGEPLLLAGNGLAKYADAFRETLGPLARVSPPRGWTVSGLGLLAAYEAALTSETAGSGEAGDLLPIYTRLSDAEEAEHQGAGAFGRLPETGVRGPAPAGEREDPDAAR